MSVKTRVGFIGLGNIGKPMAKHLLGERFELQVHDVVPAAVAELVALGATAAAPAEMAAACRYVGICVRDDHDVEALLYGENGMLARAQPGSVIAIHSTVTVAGLLKWAADGVRGAVTIIDAPMTGGAAGAAAGTLCYMVGGDAATLDAIRPMLETSSQKIIHAGELGSGIALKLCNNLITYVEFAVMSEAVRLAEACGLSPDLLFEVGKSNGVVNAQMHGFVAQRNALAKQGSAEQLEQYFGAFGRLGTKDLECAMQTAAALGVNLPVGALVKTIIEDVFVNKA